jgi:hypothetical protein
MKENFFIKIESFHSEDKGTLENVSSYYIYIIRIQNLDILKYYYNF